MHRPSWRAIVVLIMTGSTLTACGGHEEPTAPRSPATVEQGLVTLVSCPLGTAVIQYSPPLKNTPQDVTNTGSFTLSGCDALFSGVSSGTIGLNLFRPGYSCHELLTSGTSDSVITWNTLETSTLTLTRVGTRVEGLSVLYTHLGSVVSGKFAGATAIRTTTYLSADLDACSSPEGLAQLSGTATLTLLGLP
ncbi:hypothetical protein LXT21_09115 [Myxococcus sp. K38C18041901]|uniref:hypothetical protein n=1 Tax=Myxococcus guangdongensis TaxID=2906760 RepID=UPI0020A76191|nr:hypothetical protein [Myxococcus guangdongensis]MCP3058930.1 hypothetical protein [Myxococcus guangdongensis]